MSETNDLSDSEFEQRMADHADELFNAIDKARDKMNCFERRKADIFAASVFGMSLKEYVAMFEED